MALIISIELNNATFEDLATLVSTAGAAGANDSTTIEFDDEQQVLRVIIEDPIAPDIDTTDPNFFTLFDDELGDVDEDFDEDLTLTSMIIVPLMAMVTMTMALMSLGTDVTRVDRSPLIFRPRLMTLLTT